MCAIKLNPDPMPEHGLPSIESFGFVAFSRRRARKRIAQFLTRWRWPLPRQVDISADALETARVIRGEQRQPVIMVHGVTQRSGTVYVGELLRLHPDLYAFPREIWEFPFLNVAEDIRRVQSRFLSLYPPNEAAMGKDDFLPVFGASFIAYLHAVAPQSQRVLLKMPDVSQLSYFPYVFPFELPLLLLRDGRDVVQSAVHTWPQVRFADACEYWNANARIMLTLERRYADRGWRIFRFEDAAVQPNEFVRDACQYSQLDPARYPFDRIAEVSVRGSSVAPRDRRVTWDPIGKPAGFNPVGRWQNWTASQRRTFKRIAGQTLIEAGYTDDDNW